MKKTILTALGSMLLATLLSYLYFYFNTDQMAVIGWAIYGAGYVLLQFFVGFIVKSTDKNIGRGLLLGAALILLIGFSVCTAGAL